MIESAWTFADRLRDDATDAEYHLKDHLAAPLIEVRDAAVANQVLDEIRTLAIAIHDAEPVTDMNQAVAIACFRAQQKYAQKGGG